MLLFYCRSLPCPGETPTKVREGVQQSASTGIGKQHPSLLPRACYAAGAAGRSLLLLLISHYRQCGCMARWLRVQHQIGAVSTLKARLAYQVLVGFELARNDSWRTGNRQLSAQVIFIIIITITIIIIIGSTIKPAAVVAASAPLTVIPEPGAPSFQRSACWIRPGPTTERQRQRVGARIRQKVGATETESELLHNRVRASVAHPPPSPRPRAFRNKCADAGVRWHRRAAPHSSRRGVSSPHRPPPRCSLRTTAPLQLPSSI